ncbi:MAG: LacI family DNA-binding transcriptional regulator [Chloroflexota bacterium]
MPKKPTLRDIAEYADVALSTVSQALNNKPGVSPEMRQHILEVAQKLGYRQKIVVEAPLTSDIKTIGLLTKRRHDDPPLINPFYSQIIAGAERECSRHGISLMYANVEVDENSHAIALPAMLLDERVDGVIVVGAFLEETISHISKRAGQNLVFVDAYTNLNSTFDSVLIDNVEGASVAVTHLLDMGHHHIALVGSNTSSYPSIHERRTGYLNVVNQHNLEPLIIESPLTRRAGYEAAKEIMHTHAEVTAIFACNDAVAFGVLNALQDEGLSVPEDMSVVGFDNIDLAQVVSPALTTIHVDKVMMGAMAVRHLRERALDPERTSLKTLITTQLIERDSVEKIDV